jgi:cobalt-precorrin-5B (C1)-methyltransferase
MNRKPIRELRRELRRGWTTGACATAALRAALMAFWGDGFPARVAITLPGGETPDFAVVTPQRGAGWAEAGIIKDAGDDPDVTHGCEVRVRVSNSAGGVEFTAGPGVGMVTKPGLPVPVGQPAINPKPREMMQAVVEESAATYGKQTDITISVSIINGAELAKKTWNPRLGIIGGLSVLGTTGIVRPFSCAAWIASIHRGVDVARATGQTHVAGCTGATSAATVRAHFDLPEHAMLDMGDFAGGLLKYLRKHPVARLTIGGGIGKMAKLAQGAVDLHSGRSTVDFAVLADWAGDDRINHVNTALEAYGIAGEKMIKNIAENALVAVRNQLRDAPVVVDVMVIDRAGKILTRAQECA